MEIFSRQIPKRKQFNIKGDSSFEYSLQLYTEPPLGTIELKELDEIANDRLKALRSVERINVCSQVKNVEEWTNKLLSDLSKDKNFLMVADKNSEDSNSNRDEILAARKKDQTSHFILRLAYCRTEELRKWFIALETDLFKARFIRATSKSSSNISNFLRDNNLMFTQVGDTELRAEAANLAAGTYNINSVDMVDSRVFYKVPFTQAIELVRTRKVYLKNGFAYVPSTDLVTLVASVFRTKLSHALVVTAKALPQIDDDDRLVSLLQDFDKRHTGSNFSQKKIGSGTQISPEVIQQLSARSFPLCMRQMQDQLKTQHHLRHGGRMQYGLFLKAAGLTLEDAITFWRSHFTKIMDGDKFEKQYSYSIRHNYGKEGKRVNYTPYSCIKIIMTNVGPGDSHGCPFKHSDSATLHQKLISYMVPNKAISEVMDLANKGHYQIACQRYYEATHNVTIDAGINHPNQYFEESMKMHSDKDSKANQSLNDSSILVESQ